MNRNSLLKISVLSLILVLSAACSLFSGKDSEDQKSGKGSSDLLGEEYRSEGGGFTIRKAAGYDFEDVIGIVNMTAPDADKDSGPGLMAVGGLNETEMTNEELLEKMKSQSSGLDLSKGKKVKIGGADGLAADISGSYNGQAIKGRVAVVMATPRQQFSLLGIAPEEKWKDLEPIFEAVLESVDFFEPNPEAAAAMEETPPMDSVITEEATDEPQNNGAEENTAVELRQWASSARASSQYGSRDWSASQATGEPDVYACGDDVRAWASYNQYSKEWIELTYDTPVVPTEFNIYQNFNPSQVVEIYMTDVDGNEYLVRETYPEAVDCPDTYTIYVDMEKEILIDKVKIVIDQSIMGWGWAEIDAVELVGSTNGASTGGAAVPPASSGSNENPPPVDDSPAPGNFDGWMAGKTYQGYLKVIPGKTKAGELDSLIGLKGTLSTDSWKPRPDHKDTYIYKFEKDNMMAWISVTTDDVVYKKGISVNTHPSDFKLASVTRENYNKLDAIYKKDLSLKYSVMANLLKSPGFVLEQVLKEDGRMQKTVEWWGTNGEKMSGTFYDDVLTGYATLMFIPPK